MKKPRYILLFMALIGAVVFHFTGHESQKRQTKETTQQRVQPTNSAPSVSSQPLSEDDLVAKSTVRKNALPAATEEELKKLTDAEQKSLWAAFSEARREIRPIPEAWSQRKENLGYSFYSLHPKQNLTTRFGTGGVQFVSSERTYTEEDAQNPRTSWAAQMHILSLAGKNIPLGASAQKAEASSTRIEYRHSPALTEWYDNGTAAMEHGFTITQRPAGINAGDDVVIEVALDGLKAATHTPEHGRSSQLHFKEGDRTVLSYSKLLVMDAHGRELPATMKPTDIGFSLAYNDAQAAYPVTVDPLIINEEATRISNEWSTHVFGYSLAISGDSVVVGDYSSDGDGSKSGSAYVFIRSGSSWSKQAKLTANDAAAFDFFGSSVAISGDSVVVGARLNDDVGSNSGSAYVFTRSGTSWSQQAKLTASDAAEGDSFGRSVAISGDSVVVCATGDDDGGSNSGSAYVFTRFGTSWSQQAKLTASDAAASDSFGNSVAILADSVVVGALSDNSNSGSAYVFTRSGSSWSQQAKLRANDAAAYDYFGSSVAISGESVVVGAYGDSTFSGSAYVFTRSGSSWSQQAKLTANDAETFAYFGRSVAISNDSVVVGAYVDDINGSAYVFTRSGSSWSQQAKLTENNVVASDYFGWSVAISGDTVVVGAYSDDDGGADLGSAYVFTRSGSSWSQQAKLKANDIDYFGWSVAISGYSAVIGAYGDDDGGADSGSAYVFTRSGSSWSQQAKLTASDAAAGDSFGWSVAISGNSVVVGAYGDDYGGSDSGSAYVFTRSGFSWPLQAKLTASDAAAGDSFGRSVAISGDSVVVGANGDDNDGSDSGSAYVFTRSGSSWPLQAKLTANDAAAGDYFGWSVAISADSVVVGAYGDDNGGSASGSAYVFTRSIYSWSQQAKLTASDAAAGDSFGWSVAISGDSVVVGAYLDDDGGSASGSAYVFTRSGSSWPLQAKLTANDAAVDDYFGWSVAISGDSVVIGAYLDDDGGSASGSAYVFKRSGSSWPIEAKLTADDATADDSFGISVAISGDSVIVGAYGDNDGSSLGSIYPYRLAASGVSQLMAFDSYPLPLSNNSSATSFLGQQLGTSRDYTFRLYNAGELDLDLQSITLSGPNSGEFSLTFPSIASSRDLSNGRSLGVNITFSPSGVSSALRNATLLITSNDSSNSVFSVYISGLGLSKATDSDGDGMNDWAEYALRGVGFDWQRSQPNEVNDLFNNASTAGLYTQAEAAAVTGTTVLSDVDQTTNTAILTISLEDSPDLLNFNPLTIQASELSVDANGDIRVEVDAPAGKKFFKAGFKP